MPHKGKRDPRAIFSNSLEIGEQWVPVSGRSRVLSLIPISYQGG